MSLRWTGETPLVADVRAAVFSLIGSFDELATYVRQRQIEKAEHGDRTFLFEIVTGILDRAEATQIKVMELAAS